MKDLGYYNGKIAPLCQMQVPMLDRAFYFGDGVYDVMYSKNHIIYALCEHIDRFFEGMARLDIHLREGKEELCALLRRLVETVDDGEQHIYIQASRGTGVREHSYEDGVTGNLAVMLHPARIRDTYEKVDAITLADRRHGYCGVKTLNLLPNVLYAKEASGRGAYEAILHREGRVTECSHSNVSILQEGTLYTPPADGQILAGTARAHLLALCRKQGIPVREEAFTVEALFEADEILLTCSSAFCLSVAHLDGRKVGGKAPALLRTLQDGLTEDFLLSTAL